MTDKLAALNAGKWLEYSANSKPKCPHCGDDFDISENEAWHIYDDNNDHNVECPSCELSFRIRTHASWSFSTDEQDDD